MKVQSRHFSRRRGFWGVRDFWAPEVYAYCGRYYMLATFALAGEKRGTAILVADLKCVAGEPVTLFHGCDAPWSKPWAENNYVTDGPFLYCENGKLMILWSSFSAGGYTMGVAESTSGKVTGPWIPHEKPLCDADGGHGMVFHNLCGPYA